MFASLCSLVILPTNFWLSFFDAFFFGWWKDVGSIFKFGEINLIPTIVMCLSGDYTLGSWVKDMIVGNIIMFIANMIKKVVGVTSRQK